MHLFTVTTRRARLLAQSSLAAGVGLLLLVPSAALADSECGAPSGGTVTCTSAGNPYAGGVTYNSATDVTVILDKTVSATGSVAVTSAGAVTITDNGTVASSKDFGAALAGAGPTGVTISATNPVSASGQQAAGVRADTSGGAGNVAINVTDVSTTGTTDPGFFFFPNSSAINATSNSGSIAVTAGNLSTVAGNARGVLATSNTGAINITTGAITTKGASADGVYTFSNGDVTVSTGNIATQADGAAGVNAASYAGKVNVSTGAVTTKGFNADGIVADGATGAAASFSDVSVNGTFADGVTATSASGPVTVNGANVTVGDVANYGVLASSGSGEVKVALTGSVATTGDSSQGVVASSTSGAASVAVNNVSTKGDDSAAVQVFGKTASLNATGTVSTLGKGVFGGVGDAVTVVSSDGNASATVNNVSAQADTSRAVVVTASGGDATLAVNGAVSTAGANANAVELQSDTGAVTFTSAGSVNTKGDFSRGVYAVGTKSVTLTGQGSVTTTGKGSAAVEAASLTGPVSVTVGDVKTIGAFSPGIVAVADGAVTVKTGNVAVAGANSDGIDAVSNSGPVTVNATTASAADGNAINAFGAGAVAVTSGAASSGKYAAIYAQSFGGSAGVTLTGGTTTSAASDGVVVDGATTASLTVQAGATLGGALNAATLTSTKGATISNAGTINGTDYAFQVFGGPATVNSTGTISQRFSLTGNGDTFNNAGVLNASRDSDFGAGADVFNNSGVLAVLPGAGSAGAVAFTGLETFNNTGTVDLRNGHTGDVLNLPGTFNGSGGSTLALDVATGGPFSSDRLAAGGAITGSTAVVINPVGTGPAVLNPGLVIAQGGAGSSATAFTVAPASAQSGFVQYNVAFNAGTGAYSLVGSPNNAAYRPLLFAGVLRNGWNESADMWSSHMRDLRDAMAAGPVGDLPTGGHGLQFWGAFSGAEDRRDDVRQVTNFGQTSQFDFGTRQRFIGEELGVDFSTPTQNGGLALGAMGGFQNVRARFNGSPDYLRYDVGNVGVYASFNSGILFVNALAKYDHYWGDNAGIAAGYQTDFNGDVWGARGEVGLRFGSRFYVEPLAQISWVHTSVDDIAALGAQYRFDEDDGTLGRLGGRIGTSFTGMMGMRSTVYAGGFYVHEFQGRDGATFASGGQVIHMLNQRDEDYGEAIAGLNVDAGRGLSAFAEGRYSNGGTLEGGGGRVGLRMRY